MRNSLVLGTRFGGVSQTSPRGWYRTDSLWPYPPLLRLCNDAVCVKLRQGRGAFAIDRHLHGRPGRVVPPSPRYQPHPAKPDTGSVETTITTPIAPCTKSCWSAWAPANGLRTTSLGPSRLIGPNYASGRPARQ